MLTADELEQLEAAAAADEKPSGKAVRKDPPAKGGGDAKKQRTASEPRPEAEARAPPSPRPSLA